MGASRRWTSADLAQFPDDGRRREIIGGELHVSSRPHWFHQVLCSRFGARLEWWDLETDAGQAAIAPGLIFADADDVAPDVVWASRERLARILEGLFR